MTLEKLPNIRGDLVRRNNDGININFRHSKNEVVYIATQKAIDHPNVIMSKRWMNERNCWQRKGYVSIVRAPPIEDQSVEVRQPARLVIKGIIHHF